MEATVNQVVDEGWSSMVSELGGDVKELEIIKNKIAASLDKIIKLDKIVSIQKQDKKGQRLLGYLENDEKYHAAYDSYKNMKEENKRQILIQEVVSLYFLTEEYFAKLKLIKETNFLMTCVYGDDVNSKTPSGKGMYFRRNFQEILKENADSLLSINPGAEGRGGGYGLKFNPNAVAAEMQKLNDAEKKFAQNLYKHYRLFTEPYRKYVQAGHKLNEGVYREAFEMHLENLHEGLKNIDIANYSFDGCKMESWGRRWVMYRYASGSDPYFTGPDTKFSQVKAENASLISSIDTVLNTAKFIIEKHGNSKMLAILKDPKSSPLAIKDNSDIRDFKEDIYNWLVQNSQGTADEIISILSKGLSDSFTIEHRKKDNKIIVREPRKK